MTTILARYEALQQLMLDTLVLAVSGETADAQSVIDAVALTLRGRAADPAFVAEAILLPSEAFIGDQMVTVDPDAIRRELALQAAIIAFRKANGARFCRGRAARRNPVAQGKRRSPSARCRACLSGRDPSRCARAGVQDLLRRRWHDRTASRAATLAHGESDERTHALDIFYQRYRDNPLVLDKWFQVQSSSMRPDTVEAVKCFRVSTVLLIS